MSYNEQGVVIAAAAASDDVMLSPKGAELVSLSTEAAMRSFLELGTSATIDTGTSGATIPLLNGNNAYSGTATLSADVTFSDDLVADASFILGGETLAIDSNGQPTPTKSNVFVNAFNSALTDDLDNIAVTNHPVGSVTKLKVKMSGQVPTIKYAVGNTYLDENVDAVLDDVDKPIWLEQRDAADGTYNTGWYETGRSWWVFLANSLVQIATETMTTEFSISTLISFASTTPRSTDGEQVIQRSFTPRFASSQICITFSASYSSANSTPMYRAVRKQRCGSVVCGLRRLRQPPNTRPVRECSVRRGCREH